MGVDVNHSDKYGRTALYFASRKNHVDAARLLLKNKADVEKAADEGDTPFFIACTNGYDKLAQDLHKGGANINCHKKNDVRRYTARVTKATTRWYGTSCLTTRT